MKKQISFLLLVVFAVAGWAQSSDDDFFSDSAPATGPAAQAAAPEVSTLGKFTNQPAQWGGSIKSDATWTPGFVGGWPGTSEAAWKDSLEYNLLTTAWLDSRPDKDFRFRLSLRTGYPFTNDTKVVTPLPPNVDVVSTPNIKVWELFTDVTVADTLFLRFGKQSASWGVSYFYSQADVISLTAKDVTDPTAQREGPVAFKASVPFPALKANVTGFVIARETYFADDVPSLTNLGYALQADTLLGEAQVSLGGFYQKDNAPKLVATINSGLGFLNLPIRGDLNVFTEAIVSRGADVRRGMGTTTALGAIHVGNEAFASASDWDKTAYYTGTAGISYSNSDVNLSLRVEYLYNPFGYTDKDAAEKGYNAAMAGTLGVGDVTTPGVHNLTALLDLTQLGGSKLEFSTLWQHNLSDGSGWVKPYFTLYPWTQLGFTWGLQGVYGGDGTQFPVQFQAYDKNGQPQGTKRVSLVVGITFGTGRY